MGLGTADVTTKRAFEKLDTNTTYFNMITTKVLGVGKIPVVMEDDRLAIQTALKTLADVDPKRSRIVYLKNIPFPSDNHDFRSTFGQGKKL